MISKIQACSCLNSRDRNAPDFISLFHAIDVGMNIRRMDHFCFKNLYLLKTEANGESFGFIEQFESAVKAIFSNSSVRKILDAIFCSIEAIHRAV